MTDPKTAHALLDAAARAGMQDALDRYKVAGFLGTAMQLGGQALKGMAQGAKQLGTAATKAVKTVHHGGGLAAAGENFSRAGGASVFKGVAQAGKQLGSATGKAFNTLRQGGGLAAAGENFARAGGVVPAMQFGMGAAAAGGAVMAGRAMMGRQPQAPQQPQAQQQQQQQFAIGQAPRYPMPR